MPLAQIVEKLKHHPKKLFLIDGLGAMVSAFLLGVVLVRLERYFGIPPSTLYFLATLPILFAIYDFYCYRKENDVLGQFLKGIAVANLSYCCLSLGFAFYHSNTITNLGWAYVLGEIFIVVLLATIELGVAKRLTSGSKK